LDNEIKIFNEILKFDKDNKYIIKMIDHGEDLYNSKIKKYLVLEYAPKGTLFDYIYDENNYFNGGLGEKYGKFIFSKILIGVQAIHNAGICHLDLTLKNILLDENFNPKIADFGLAHLIGSKINEKIYFNKGTIGFASPERLFNMPFNGIKADIFSLGVILLYLVTGKPTFQIPEARLNDEAYKNIIKKAYNLFWNNIDQTDSLSKEFKDLYEKMVHYTASKRPSINDILDHPWMKKDLYNNEKEEDL